MLWFNPDWLRRFRWCMSYRSSPSWESCPWFELGILVLFRLRQVLEVRLTPTPCATSSIRAGTLTLRQEKETDASFGTPIRGPWVGLGTCEPAQARHRPEQRPAGRVRAAGRHRPGAPRLDAAGAITHICQVGRPSGQGRGQGGPA